MIMQLAAIKVFLPILIEELLHTIDVPFIPTPSSTMITVLSVCVCIRQAAYRLAEVQRRETLTITTFFPIEILLNGWNLKIDRPYIKTREIDPPCIQHSNCQINPVILNHTLSKKVSPI